MAAKGGAVADITVGDCTELLDVAADVCTLPHHKSPYFYQVLHALGVLGNTAAPTVRALSDQRQLSVEQLVDRCGIQCRPVRDLLVDYLRERQARSASTTSPWSGWPTASAGCSAGILS